MNYDPSATRPYIGNLTLTSANTEYSLELPTYMKSITIKLRNTAHSARFAFKAGGPNATTGTFITIPAGGVPFEQSVKLAGTIYFESPDAGAVVEIFGMVQSA